MQNVRSLDVVGSSGCSGRVSAQTDTGLGVSTVKSEGRDKQATSVPNEASKVRKCIGMMMSEMNYYEVRCIWINAKAWGSECIRWQDVSAARQRGEGREGMVIEVDRLGSLQLWGPSVQDR